MSRAAPADYREFVRVSVDLPLNPKLATIDNPAAGWAYVVSLCYCGQNLTDGSFPKAVLLRLAGVDASVADQLVEAGLWHAPSQADGKSHGKSHDNGDGTSDGKTMAEVCPRCPHPLPGMLVVHDYLVHQRSADEAHALRDARRQAGRRGAATRWSAKADGKSHGKSHDNGDGTSDGKTMATGVADAWQIDSNPMAEVEGHKKTSSSTSAKPPRQDVEKLCTHFADLVEASTDRRPNITKRWRDAARLLLDNDLAREQDPLGLAIRLADWTANDEFWRPNVLSIPTFREKFAQLRLKARAEQQIRRNGSRRTDFDALQAQFTGGVA